MAGWILFSLCRCRTPVPLGQISKEQFEPNFDVNVRGLLFIVRRALSLLPDGSSILLCQAFGTTRGIAGLSVYPPAKQTCELLLVRGLSSYTAQNSPTGYKSVPKANTS
jgi:NAD(P)-dependent dehydrogenase (short-subunit alcohol dehydrogenase family)